MRETPPGRYLRYHLVAAMILEAIPYDGWVTAAEISAAVGVTPHVVGALIRFNLLGAYVERRKASIRGRGHYLYRCLPQTVAPAGPSTSRWSPATDDTDDISTSFFGHQPAES